MLLIFFVSFVLVLVLVLVCFVLFSFLFIRLFVFCCFVSFRLVVFSIEDRNSLTLAPCILQGATSFPGSLFFPPPPPLPAKVRERWGSLFSLLRARRRETLGTRLVCELHCKWFELNRHKGGEGGRCQGKISSLLPNIFSTVADMGISRRHI